MMADKLEGTDNGELIVALEGNDTMVNAGAGDDTVDAGDGHDLVMGGPGADMLNGGDGTDTVSYMYSPEGVMITINLRGNLASGGDAEGDSLENFENVIGARNADEHAHRRQGRQQAGWWRTRRCPGRRQGHDEQTERRSR